MRSPEGRDYWCSGVYTEIVAPERIVFSAVLEHDPGNKVLTTLTFEEEGTKTRLTVLQTFVVTATMRQGAPRGWSETMDRLGDFVGQG
jgi:uncharacterized protein YndB with AHSA1/START domain